MPVIPPRAMSLALFGALTALAALGCDEVQFAPGDAAVSACSAACPEGLSCMAGVCVSASPPVYPVALRFHPQVDDGLATAELQAFELPDAVYRLPTLPLGAQAALSGRVVDADGEVLVARVAAQAQQGIDNPPLAYAGEVVDAADGPAFLVPVAPFWPTEAGGRRGVVYGLTVRPELAARYPPWQVDVLRPLDDDSPLDVVLPPADRLPTIEGEVLISPENPSPVEGLRVFAVDEAERRVSTEATTDATGRFALRFWPAARERVRVMRVRRSAEVGPLPEVDVEVMVPADADDERPFARVYLGPLPPTTALVGTVTDGVAPVAGVVVRMRGEVGAGVFEIRAGPTDAEGRFEATLYPGAYLVDLEPPADSPWRLARFRVELGAGEQPRWTVQPRASVRGVVRTPDGRVLPRARVEAQLVTPQFNDPTLAEVAGALSPRTRQIESDADGRFTLLLDPGVHTLHVVPPGESGLPSCDHPLVVPALPGELPEVDVTVPAAAALSLSVDGPFGPAAGVTVEAWRTDTEPDQRVAEGVTASNGSVVLRLPIIE